MKVILLTFLLLGTAFSAIIRSYIDEQGRPIDHHVGTYMVRDANNGLYRVKYNVEMLGGNMITNLDEVNGIRRVQCDLTNIEMVVDFNSVPAAYNFYKSVKSDDGFEKFLTSGKYNCSETQADSFMTMRRVLEAELNGVQVLLRTSTGTYEDTFKEASIQVEPADEPEEYSKTFCFGANANADCTAAKYPIPIYKNKFVELQCSNCFVGAKATVFMDFRISWFKLRHIGTGMRDISVNGAFVLDLTAQASASGTLDRTYRIVDSALIVQFWIGPVPITIWYEIPLRLLATASMNIRAHAEAGVKATWSLGNAYVEWDENSGWKVAKPEPSFKWEPVLSGEASLEAEASLSLAPSFIIHIMRIASAQVRVEPTLLADLKGNTQEMQLCADLNYKVVSDITATVGLNLPLVKLLEKTFGPYEILNTGVKPIGHWCVGKKNSELTQ